MDSSTKARSLRFTVSGATSRKLIELKKNNTIECSDELIVRFQLARFPRQSGAVPKDLSSMKLTTLPRQVSKLDWYVTYGTGTFCQSVELSAWCVLVMTKQKKEKEERNGDR